ncbi:MAG: response regulator [Clostridia bacterium]|nr:response regulator [Clostridia bacterium]MDQ7791782.1 response regulator [Clostridia bacterium]
MRISILIVEDDPMVADINKRFVESIHGFTVIASVATGIEAINAVRDLKPDLTLLDVYLPDLNGVEVLQEIRRQNLPTDVILITAAQDTSTIQDVFRYGAIDYIIKPFKLARLVSALKSYETLHRSFHHQSSLDQETLDRLTLVKPPEDNPGRLPKGLHEVTLKQVMLYLIQQDRALSAEEVASGVGLARVTARRYLEYLEKTGKAMLELKYGSVGRPVNRYRHADQKD